MVFLEDESYSFILEPAQGLCVAEVPEEPFHEFLSSWIGLAKGTDAFEGIGQVASSAPCYRNLRKGSFPGLIDVDFSRRDSSLQLYCADAPCRSCSDDRNFHVFRGVATAKIVRIFRIFVPSCMSGFVLNQCPGINAQEPNNQNQDVQYHLRLPRQHLPESDGGIHNEGPCQESRS